MFDWNIKEKMKVEGRNIKRTLYELKIKSKNPHLYEIEDIGHVIIEYVVKEDKEK